MFTNLEIAKKLGMVRFDWSETAVVVSVKNWGRLEPFGVLLTESKDGDPYRTEVEWNLAHEAGIVDTFYHQRGYAWVPEDLG